MSVVKQVSGAVRSEREKLLESYSLTLFYSLNYTVNQ